jgi:hypothetical protein
MKFAVERVKGTARTAMRNALNNHETRTHSLPSKNPHCTEKREAQGLRNQKAVAEQGPEEVKARRLVDGISWGSEARRSKARDVARNQRNVA